MATTVSLEYLESVFNADGGTVSLDDLTALFNAANGIPKLDAEGKIPDTLLSDAVFGAFLGNYDDLAALVAVHPTAAFGQYGIIGGETYYYNAARDGGAWSAVSIELADYTALSAEAKAGQPDWLILPDAAEEAEAIV